LRADDSGWSYVHGLSPDGTVAVGHSSTDDGTNRSFRWTEATGVVDLRSARSDGGGYTYSYGMTPDGNVLVGYGRTDGANEQALLWRFASTAASDFELLTLGSLQADGTGYSYANLVSRDGRVVAGHARTDDDHYRAFAWTEAEGMMDLGSLRSDGLGQSYPYHMTPDGSVIVGYAESDDGRNRAFLWRGTMLDMVNTQIQLQATAAAVGRRRRRRRLRRRCGWAPSWTWRGAGSPPRRRASRRRIEAAPARAPVALSIGGGLTRNGDVGTRGSVDVIAATALPGGYTLGGFVELGREASSSGLVELDGTQVAGGISLRYRADPGFTGLTWRVAALAESGRADITREALLPGTLAGSGNARITTAAASVEVGQGFATASGVVIPYARLSHGRTTRSAYAEAGATGFPLSFEEHEDDATTLTLGVDSRMAVGAQGTLRLGAGVSHDLSRSTDPIRGTSAIPGFTSFEVAGPALENRTRLHLEASYSHSLANGAAVTGSAGIAQQPWSSTPSIGVRIGYDMRF
jgi:probable HAF family extracellular repeat protein